MCFCACYPSGSEEDLFYDAPSSPIGDKPFFPDNPMPLRYGDLHKRKSLIKEDTQKNMTDFIMKFEISEVQMDRGDKHSLTSYLICNILSIMSSVTSNFICLHFPSSPYSFPFFHDSILIFSCPFFLSLLFLYVLFVHLVFCSVVSSVWGSGGHSAPFGHRRSGHWAEAAHLWHDIKYVPSRDLPQVSWIHGWVVCHLTSVYFLPNSKAF